MKKISFVSLGTSYRNLMEAVMQLEKAANRSLEELTALFLAGYTMQPPPAPDYHELERMAAAGGGP